MSSFFRSSLAVPVAAVLFAVATAPLAQSPAAGTPPGTDGAPSNSSATRDPGDARASVPAVAYSSAFARYRSNAEAEVGSWRRSNDNVGRIGGWRIYGREASEPEGGKQTNDSKPAAPAATPGPQHGHKH